MFPLALLIVLGSVVTPQPVACDDVASCRQAALAAAERQDYEAFHDFAWRAVQRGRRNDPDLMYLLARAQSLSGRPGDALVMLRRIAEMRVAMDAATDDDFNNVRSLPGWADLEALMTGLSDPPLESKPGAATAAAPPASGPPAAIAPPTSTPVGRPEAAERTAAPAAAPPAPRPAPLPGKPAPARLRGESARRLAAGSVDAAGMAYDSASRRFVLGDRRLNKLIVADEVFDQVNDLIGALAGGFGSLTALAIDSRRGDLWVTSRATDGGAWIHRLQLVSGRLLSTVEVPDEWRPVDVTDVAVDDGGTLLLLDAAGSRLLWRRGDAGTLQRAISLGVTRPTSLALNGTRAYIAHEEGLSVADTAAGRVQHVRTAAGVTLSGLQRIRWHAGSLVGIQTVAGAGDRLVRIRLTRTGPAATAVDVLDVHAGSAGAALTISRDAAYYLIEDDGVQVIRRVPLK